MKISIAIATLTSIVTAGSALAQSQPLTYTDIVREARRYEKLELSERVVSNKVLLQKASNSLRQVTTTISLTDLFLPTL